ncbi:hypothetical protein [Paenibacillus sp. GCM10027626]|uniref:hypothetical protein n=1 Tax=Paenibacillus sp. GCM10027626 TaxID=3273411 RepID=UPI003643A592
MNPLAMQMIHDALEPHIKSGLRVEDFKLFVSRQSRMAEKESVDTSYGLLRIYPSEYVPKGAAYVREDFNGRIGMAFAWVSKPKEG